MPKKTPPSREHAIESAVEEMMQAIDEHELAGTEVSRDQTIDFLRGIVSACNMRIETIRQEQKNDDEEEEPRDEEE